MTSEYTTVKCSACGEQYPLTSTAPIHKCRVGAMTEDRVREISREVAAGLIVSYDEKHHGFATDLEMTRKARDEALEEAARMFEEPSTEWPCRWPVSAQRIRSLKRPSPAREEPEWVTCCPACGRYGDHAENCTPMARKIASGVRREVHPPPSPQAQGGAHQCRSADIELEEQARTIASLRRDLDAAKKERDILAVKLTRERVATSDAQQATVEEINNRDEARKQRDGYIGSWKKAEDVLAKVNTRLVAAEKALDEIAAWRGNGNEGGWVLADILKRTGRLGGKEAKADG